MNTGLTSSGDSVAIGQEPGISSSGVVPMVSVCMITYNHEPFIAQAIESIVTQKTAYSFELVIGEDCSKDNTRRICEEYQHKYPHIITLLDSTSNLGMMKNGMRTVHACKGKYLTFCEGDDYWNDPYKIAKQIDFLELNPEYGFLYTNFNRYIQNTNTLLNNQLDDHPTPEGYLVDSLMKGNYFATPTVCVRNHLVDKFYQTFSMERIRRFYLGDYSLWLFISYHMKGYYLKDATATYRVLENSVSHFKNKRKQRFFRLKGFMVRFYFAFHYKTKARIRLLLIYRFISFLTRLVIFSILYSFLPEKKTIPSSLVG
ncbi:MAG: glycosyltransferase [Bacteroidetes bacterium]|nr:glycosyltransferase [Bacteroidota bacterium]